MRNIKVTVWTDEKIANLRLDWEAKLTVTQIARRFKLSRNAIIGKVRRLGLDKRTDGHAKLNDADREQRRIENNAARVERQRIARGSKRGERRVDLSQTNSPMTPLPEFVGTLNIPFADLRPFSTQAANQCRFIADEPPGPIYPACGNETEPGKSYCPVCWDRCHGYQTEASSMRKAA